MKNSSNLENSTLWKNQKAIYFAVKSNIFINNYNYEKGSLKITGMLFFSASWRGGCQCLCLIDNSWQAEPLYQCCVTANMLPLTLPRT